MEIADNDEGFASCEEDEENDIQKKVSQRQRTGDPFLDLELDLEEVKDEQAKSTLFMIK